MFIIKVKYYSIIVILISLLILIPIYFSILSQIEIYESNRIYKITKVPSIYRASLMHKFLNKQYVKNSILLIGDSQPYGFRYSSKDVFSTLLSKKIDQKVINVAFRDARIIDNIHVLEYLKQKNMKFKTIIFNVNPAHPQEAKQYRLDLNNSVDYKIGILKNSKYFRDFINHFNPETTANMTFYKYMLSPHFFDMPKKSLDHYLSSLKKLIILAKSISQQVIIYASPHYVGDFKRLKLNSSTIVKFEEKVSTLCKENNVTFLKPDISDKKYFNDIVHFNAKGHRKMADILYKIIKK